MREPWGERFEASLVHLGDYEPVQDAQRDGSTVSMSAGASRAETRGGEHSAQPQRSEFEELERAWHDAIAPLYAALAAVLDRLVLLMPPRPVRRRARRTRPGSR